MDNVGPATRAWVQVHTSVVLPAPCTPLRPMKKAGGSAAALCASTCLSSALRMNGTQCSDLSSMIWVDIFLLVLWAIDWEVETDNLPLSTQESYMNRFKSI